MSSQTTATNVADDFEAAKGVVEKLKDIPKDRQERILRWVAESLGLANPAAVSPLVQQVPHIGVPLSTEATLTAHTPVQQHAPVDIASYVREKRPRSDIQFVTVVAHYYRFVAPEAERRDAITPAVAQEATRLANRDRLSNAKSTLHNAKRQGYLDSRSRGEFAINTVGENLVARSLPGGSDGDDAAPQRRGGRKASSRRRTAAKKKATKKKRG